MTAALLMARPLTRWQRFVSGFLPWYNPEAQDRRIAKTERLADEVDRRLRDQRIRLGRIDAAIDVTRARHDRRATDR
jgi:hypothetical protein